MRVQTRSRRFWGLGALLLTGCNAIDGLDTAYSESGGSWPTEVTEASHLVLWLQGDDWNGSTWPDHSGSGRDASTYYGTVGVGSLRGHGVAEFDGHGDLIITAGFPEWSGVSILAVVKTPIQNGSCILSMGTSFNSKPCYMLPPGGAPGCEIYDALQFNTLMSLEQCDGNTGTCYQVYGLPDAVGAGWVRLSGVLTAGATPSYQVYLNGVDEGLLGHNLPYPYPAPWSTGRHDTIVGWGALEPVLFPGSIAEIIVFNTSLSDASRQAIDAYLAAKWGP